MKQLFKGAGIALAITIAAAPATGLAESSAGATVRTDDLDLTTAAGKATLDRRTNTAAMQVCAGETATESRISAAQARQQCIDDVREQIRRQLVRRAN